jgi:hypothetical protein
MLLVPLRIVPVPLRDSLGGMVSTIGTARPFLQRHPRRRDRVPTLAASPEPKRPEVPALISRVRKFVALQPGIVSHRSRDFTRIMKSMVRAHRAAVEAKCPISST